MQVSKKEGRVLNNAINKWVENGVISAAQSSELKESYVVTPFDWKRLARYSFWLAIVCVLIAISSLLADKWLLVLLATLFTAPEVVKCAFFTALATLLYYLGVRRKAGQPGRVYSNEAIFFLAVAATAAAIAYLGMVMDNGSGHFSLLLLLAALVYALLGLWFPSRLVWLFALLALGSWFGAETGYASGWGAYYLGMNYPLRFVAFALVLLACGSFVFGRWHNRSGFWGVTKAVGLLYLFVALWLLSIFGNYGEQAGWFRAGQAELLFWSLLFAVAAGVAIWHGLKQDDGMSRGFGLVFIFINLYTRFFEYFWGGTHKAVFFALLALSFWYLGSRAEKIWQLSLLKSRRE